ncbi:MAG: uracil-DNA glycosylase, partial [Planctomycetaceae bacterium]
MSDDTAQRLRKIAVQRLESLQRAGVTHLPRPSAEPVLSKAEQLRCWAERVAQCVRCQELARTRTQTVFGVGNPDAEILFIGEAPGADEDRQGEPFVGRAGQLLNDIIRACGLTREEVYICNILKCRPPGNRNPTPTEAENCREHLDAQIELVDPGYIVCWGSVAAQNLLGTTSPIGRMRGKFYQHGRAKVVCTYHP